VRRLGEEGMLGSKRGSRRVGMRVKIEGVQVDLRGFGVWVCCMCWGELNGMQTTRADGVLIIIE
jgi:hypothetical protein